MQHLVISGPSGVGKGELIRLFTQAHPGAFTTTVSHTSRAPRPGEIDGKHCHFIPEPTFKDMIEKQCFAEYTRSPSGVYYGTTNKAIQIAEEQKRPIIFEIDIEGAQQLHSKEDLSATYIFIKPPSFEVLSERLRKRGTEKEDVVEERLKRAKGEILTADELGLYGHIIVNDRLDAALMDLHKCAFSAKRG